MAPMILITMKKVDKMSEDIKVKEASEIIFPIFLRAVEAGEESYLDYKKIKKWAEITLKILNDIYPPDIFVGVSGDKGVQAVVLIREILKEGLKKEV